MRESVNEDDPQGATLVPAGPDVSLYAGRAFKCAKRGEEIVHFQIHATHYRPAVINPADQV